MAFAFLAEYFVDDFSFAHCFVDLDPDFLQTSRNCASSMPLMSIPVCSLIASSIVIRLNGVLKLIVFSPTLTSVVPFTSRQIFLTFFGEIHHPVVVLVRDIDFHTGKFRIVRSVHAFVAEVFGKFVHSFEASDNQPFQI